MATGLVSWSTTAASNATADSNVNWAEGQAPSSVNDSARAMMSSVAKFRDDTNGSIATGGTSTAFTITSNQSFASLTAMDNAVIAFVPHTTSGSAPTLAVDGITAKKIRLTTGNDLPSGVLIAGTPYVVTYENGVGEFLLHNLATFDHFCPIACGFDYWGSTAPNGSYAFPVGQAISRTTYSRLFALIGTAHGVGDGSTTFNLPDRRGRGSVSPDNMGGSDASLLSGVTFTSGDRITVGGRAGTATHTLTQAQLPVITPAGSISASTLLAGVPSGGVPFDARTAGTGASFSYYGPGGSGGTNFLVTTATFSGTSFGGGAAHPIMQPTILCNYIMRIL